MALLVALGCGDDVSTAGGTDTDGSDDTGTTNPTSGTAPSTESTGSTSGATDPTEGSSSSATTTTAEPPVPPPLEAPSLALGTSVSCEVADDGSRWCWGSGACGRIGDGTDWGRGPEQIDPPGTWRSLDLGFAHGCGIDSAGALWCFGDGLEGQVGDGQILGLFDGYCRLDRVEIDPGTTWAQVATGAENTCGVREDGTLWCWGNNDYGQIGDGSVGSIYARYWPVQVAGDDWQEVFVGEKHACARRSDDTLWCWGQGGVLGDDTQMFSSTPVLVMGPASWKALARGGQSNHTCAVASDDTLWCWGQNSWGVLGTETKETAYVPMQVDIGGPVVEVSVGPVNTCAIREDATLLCWGSNTHGQLAGAINGDESSVPVEVSHSSGFTDVRVGARHVCARDEADAVHCWGRNVSGEAGDGTSGSDNSPRGLVEVGAWGGSTPWAGFTAVAAGRWHSCATRQDDTLWCWGLRYDGQLGTGDSLDDCSASNPLGCHYTTPWQVAAEGPWDQITAGHGFGCGIMADSTLWCWGEAPGVDANVPTSMPGTDWLAISAGGDHICGIQTPGTLWCWGSAVYGQVGTGDVGVGAYLDVPTQVGSDTDWIAVESGDSHACGIRQGGTMYCWGLNLGGQIGNGMVATGMTPEELAVPTPVAISGTWSAVSAGSTHTCAVATDDSLWCWGSNRDGAVGDGPSGDDEFRPAPVQIDGAAWAQVSAGNSLTCARRADQTLWCWGSNDEGGVGNGAIEPGTAIEAPTQVGSANDWIDLASHRHVCGLRGDGSLWCWGANLAGMQGNDTIFISGEPREVLQ